MTATKDQIEDDQLWADDDGDNAQDNKYLLFNLAEEVYGISIVHVINIIELQKVTEVPDMPVYVKGVINLRGNVIPVMDLRVRFNIPPRVYDDRTCIIIVKIVQKSVGFIVDRVAEVHDILPKDIEPPIHFKKADVQKRYISGLGKVGEEVRILLDVETILEDESLEKAI